MRGEKEMFELILDVATRNECIRAVILNGSRANPNAKRDVFQDYDIVYFVQQLGTFTENHDWIDVFGERVILQLPDEMNLPGYENDSEKVVFAYLMLFKDGNRIDLTLFPLDKLETHYVFDSLSIMLLDKDSIFGEIPTASEADYLIRKPTEKEFRDVCNEFWWVSTYVAKGLQRGEIVYAKDFLGNQVRKMFMKMIEWRVGAENDFAVNFGANGKFLARYVDAAFYAKILQTYADAEPENIWNSLFLMAEIFEDTAVEIAARLGFGYNAEESGNVVKYLEGVKNKGEN